MSFTRGSAITSNSDSASSNTIISPPSGSYNQAAHDNLFVVVKWEGNNTGVTLSDVAGNTFIGRNKGNNSTDQESVQIFECLDCKAHASNVITAVFADNATYKEIIALRYTSTNPASFVAQPAAATGTGTAATTASFTAGTFSICGAAEFSGITATPGSGWTEQFDSPSSFGGHVEDRIDAPGGTIVAAMTMSSSVHWIIVGASYTDASAPALMAQSCQ